LSSEAEPSNGDGSAAVEAEGEGRAGSFSEPRAGERALSVLATPLNLVVLRALASRPMRLAELRQATGLPAQTTLRGHLATLSEIGVLSKRPTQQMPYAVENELTPMGREMLDVAEELEAWLATAPEGPIPLEGGGAKGVIKAFVDGWASTMMRGLAAQPMSLTELDRLIADLSYPALERRLASMRMAGLIEARPSRGAGTPYAVTDWARRGVAPLAVASRCERVHMRQRAAPITQTDIEAAFMLATPLVGLSADVAGACRLEVDAPAGAIRQRAGVTVRVEGGKVVSCDSKLAASPGAFAAGSTSMWFSAVKEGTPALLRFGGSRQLPEGLVTGLHTALKVR
jgi:DNA-binding HxlR family transcriptional regulator